MRKWILYLILLVWVLPAYVFAQDDYVSPKDRFYSIDTPVTVDLDEIEEEENAKPRKKKRKKNVFYGLKTKKGFTKTGYGDNTVLELFYYLKEYKEPDK